MIKIDKGIPLPVDSRRGGSESILAKIKEMEIGDSFFLTDLTKRMVTNRVSYYRQKTGYTFKIREVEGGVRVWRSEGDGRKKEKNVK